MTKTSKAREERLETCSRSVTLEVAPETVFAFCSSRVGFIAHYPNPIRGYRGPEHWVLGSEFWLDYRYMSFPMTWHGRITQLEANHSFTDEMVSGMFKRWEHTHTVEPAAGGTGGTLYTDTVRFSLGWGRLIDRQIVKPSLDKFFERRHELLLSALQGKPWHTPRAAERCNSASGG